jgi:hypothetical protein
VHVRLLRVLALLVFEAVVVAVRQLAVGVLVGVPRATVLEFRQECTIVVRDAVVVVRVNARLERVAGSSRAPSVRCSVPWSCCAAIALSATAGTLPLRRRYLNV